MAQVLVAALYRFSTLDKCDVLRAALQSLCDRLDLRGTLLLASEGINGTVAGSESGVRCLIGFLREQPGFEALEPKFSVADNNPFHRMKVRIKSEIVSMGDKDVDPRERVGTYVDAKTWNDLLDDPEVIVLDTRNHYEVRVGTFERAHDPGIESFRDFPSWARANLDASKGQRIAMFCTGGIRCEKASALLLREGFDEVFHLEGGILRYLETTPESESRWKGECFVFDQRVALDHGLEPGTHTLCFGCQEPVSLEEARSSLHEHGVCCVRCHERTPQSLRERRRERGRQVALAHRRGKRHIGS